MFNADTNLIRNEPESSLGIDLDPENNGLLPSPFPREKTSTRSEPEYHDLIGYEDVLVIRNLNSPISMQIADYFQAKRNISSLNICNITTSSGETVSRTIFENEIRTPVEDHITNNGLLGTINFIVTTKGVPLRVAEEDTSDDDWNQPWTIDRASVDAELALILGFYQSSIGVPMWINNPYFDPSPYEEFSFLSYGYFLVSRLTGYDFDDIKAMIDCAEKSIGRKGTFVLDLDPGKDGGGYQSGNDWMRDANTTLTANGFDVLLDETNIFLTNQIYTSGYTSWGSNDGNYPSNTILNPSFENDANGDDVPDNWFFVNDVGAGSCSRNDTEFRNGAWSVRISRTLVNEKASYIAQNFTVKPDTRYYAAGYANLSGISSDMGAHLQIRAYDSQGKLVKYYNGSARTGTTNNWVSLSQVHYEPLTGIINISIGVAISKSTGTAFFDDVRLYEIKPHNHWIPGALAETYVSTGGRSFNYPTAYGQSLVADLIRDGVTGVKGYVYEPYLSACAHPDVLFGAYTQGFFSAESYYMASAFLGWMDCVVGDPKVSPYDLSIAPDLSINSKDISFSDDKPREGEIVNISAIIENLGLAPVFDVEVGFYAGDPFNGGIYLGSINLDIDGSGSNTTSFSWDTSGYLGDYNITVVVDPKDLFYELSEGNNMANASITVNTGYPIADAGPDGIVDEDMIFIFNGSASSDNTSIANYTWNFGDGNLGYSMSPIHTYTSQGTYVILLNVTNVFGLWDLDTVNITVNNAQPTADAGGDKFGYEGETIDFNASGSTDTPSDVDSLNYTWHFWDGITRYGKIFTYPIGDNGTYSVILEVRDDDGAVDIDTIIITLDNLAPAITPVSQQILQEDSPFYLQIIASDVSADTITFTDNSSMFDIDSITGVINFTPRNQDVGTHIIKITARDEDGGESSIEFSMIVKNTNDPPHIVSSPITEAVEEEHYQYEVVVEDEDTLVSSEVITFYLDSAPLGMEIDSQGRITWIPTDSQASNTYDIIVRVSDGEEYDLQVFEITVTNINDEPVIVSTPITTAVEDSYYTYDIIASDVDMGDVLTYKLDFAPQNMSIDEASGKITWLPTNDLVGNNKVKIKVIDVDGAYDTQEFFILVDNVNDLPILEHIDDLVATEDEPFYYQVNAMDIDLYDSLSFYDDSELFEIDENTGIIHFTPTNHDVGVKVFNITVADENGGTAHQTVCLTIENMNDPPSIDQNDILNLSDGISLSIGESYHYKLNAFDEDMGDTLMFSDNTDLFDVDPNTGEISFTPERKDVGTHSIKITVKDSEGDTDYMIITFEIVGEEEDEGFDFMWLVLLLVIVIIIILILFMFWRRKKEAIPHERTVFFGPLEVGPEMIENPKPGKIQPPYPPPPPPP
jgi:uncharacterized protein (TIGR03790 family)